MAAKKRPQKTKKQKKEDQAYWRAEFWKLYDPEKVRLSYTFRDRLEREDYYSAQTYKQQCVILHWIYDHMEEFGVDQASLHGHDIRMWKEPLL